MRAFLRILVFVLAVFSSAVAAAFAFIASRGGEWGVASDVLQFAVRIEGNSIRLR